MFWVIVIFILCGFGVYAAYEIAQHNAKKEANLQQLNSENDETFTGYTSSFDTARVISKFVYFVGWFLVGISPVILLVCIHMAIRGGGDVFLIGLFASLVVAIIGILVVMSGQLTRAVVDTADNTGQLLAVMKNKK